MEAEKSQGSVLKAILQAKEMSEIKGIYGRMGDLGAIDGESFTVMGLWWHDSCLIVSMYDSEYNITALWNHIVKRNSQYSC